MREPAVHVCAVAWTLSGLIVCGHLSIRLPLAEETEPPPSSPSLALGSPPPPHGAGTRDRPGARARGVWTFCEAASWRRARAAPRTKPCGAGATRRARARRTRRCGRRRAMRPRRSSACAVWCSRVRTSAHTCQRGPVCRSLAHESRPSWEGGLDGVAACLCAVGCGVISWTHAAHTRSTHLFTLHAEERTRGVWGRKRWRKSNGRIRCDV